MKGFVNNKVSRERAIIITQTPMRITLAGGGTDVNWYSNLKGGAWISASFNRYLIVTLSMTEDPEFIGYSYGEEAVQGNSYKMIPNLYVKECLKYSSVTKGISINISSEVSGRSGLGGSAALEVGLLHALYCYKRQSVSQLRLAKEAFRIESVKLKRDYIGPQDQYIVSLGGIKYFERDTSGKVIFEDLPVSLHTISELESNLLFFRTGIYRDAHIALKEQKNKASTREIKALDKIQTLGQKAKKYLLKGDIDSFGSTFDEHWHIKKTLSDKVSNPQIDKWYNEAKKMGSLGGKIMGAGGGGWFVFYVKDKKDAFRKRMSQLGLEERKVKFDWEGSKLLVNIS
ncbi:hypothetical protein HYW41_02110 [Candidatus Daviesbacteria bacterium]|nr:hypothetical protein [Candidatus Daviesbacteria bacterium]